MPQSPPPTASDATKASDPPLAPAAVRAIFIFAFLGWMFDFYDLFLIGFVREKVTHEFSLGESASAWMLGIALGTSGLGGIVSGWLADRYGKRNVLAATVLMYSLGSLVAGLAPSFAVFLVGRGLVGLGVGGEWAIGHAMVAEAVRSTHRGRASAALQAGEPVGAALAALVGFLLVPILGWRMVMIISSSTALLALFMRRSLVIPKEAAGTRATFADLQRARVFGRMFLAWILGVLKLGTYWTCYTWLPSFLVERMHQSVGKSLTWVLTAQVGQFLGMIAFGNVSDRFGRRPAFCAFSLLTASALAPLAFGWTWLSAHPPIFWATMFALGVGAGCTAGFGALLAELFPLEVRSLAMGTTYNMARAVQLGAPVLVGFAVLHWDIAGGLSVPLSLAVLTAAWVWVLPETRGTALASLRR